MSASKPRRLVISRTSAREGLIYEVVSHGGYYQLPVKLTVVTRKWLNIIPVIIAWRIEFQSPKDSTVASMRVDTLEVKLSSPEGVPKGHVHEASFSRIGKAIIEDESGQTIGWFDYGFNKDHLFLGDGRAVGFFARLPMKDLPLALSPSKAYLASRFEMVHDRELEFGERLISAWICRTVWQERDNSCDRTYS